TSKPSVTAIAQFERIAVLLRAARAANRGADARGSRRPRSSIVCESADERQAEPIAYNRAHALAPPGEDLADFAQVRTRRVPARPRALPLAAADSARDHVLARHLCAARGAAAARAPRPGADLRQVRAGALDPSRPAAAGHRGRTGETPGSRA